MNTNHRKIRRNTAKAGKKPLVTLSASQVGRFSRRLLLTTTALCAVGMTAIPDAAALPQGGQVIEGAAEIVIKSATEIEVRQSSQKVVIDWQSFNLAANEKIQFVQIDQLAQALNRILGPGASQILGQLSANGMVILTNPNGISFGAGSKVDVQALIATTANIANRDFMAGKLNFDLASTNSGATVINQGTITAGQAGLVALVAPGVENSGLIQAKFGKVELASGNTFTVDLYGDKLIQVAVSDKVMGQITGIDGQPLAALVSNSGTIDAEGGTIVLTANAARGVVASAINMDGIARARTVAQKDGMIVLDGGDSGIVSVAGTLDASGRDANEKGGTVKVLGEKVALADGARLDVAGDAGGGTALVGGNWQGQGPERNAARTFVAAGASIDASAVTEGDGGTVVAWADDITRFNGSVSANGGALAGNGGNIEVSGKNYLEMRGQVSLSAPKGRAGSLLLDPTNITIATNNPGGYTDIAATTEVDQFADAGTDTWVTPEELATWLGLGNVTLQASNDITFSNDVSVAASSGSGYRTLTVQANNDINVNAAISASSGRLNVVLTSDYDDNNAGSVSFGGAGRITTNNGNFISGYYNGVDSIDAYERGATVSARGQNLSMASGSFVNTGNGYIQIAQEGTVSLAADGLQVSNGNYYHTNSTAVTSYKGYVSITADTITSDTVNNTSEISSAGHVILQAGTIGGSGFTGNEIEIAGSAVATKTLFVINTTGNSYVEERSTQAFSLYNVTSGNGLSQTHQIRNAIGGVTETMQIDTASGALAADSGEIVMTNKTRHLTLTVTGAAVFDNASVNIGSGSLILSASAGTITSKAGSVNDGDYEIRAANITLTGTSVGTVANRLEIDQQSGASLTVTASAGTTQIDSEGSAHAGSISMTYGNTAATHRILLGNTASSADNVAAGGDDSVNLGDFVAFSSDGTNLTVPTINAATPAGIQLTNKNFVLTYSSGDVLLQNTSVNLGTGNFTISASSGSVQLGTNAINTASGSVSITLGSGVAGASIAATNAKDGAAEITAGNVTLSTNSASSNGAIGNIEIAQGAGAAANTLTINGSVGNIDVVELTANHFKSTTLNVYGAQTTGQSISVALAGADDINFSDDGTNVVIDATKVNLSANNRNFSLYMPSRSIQVDSNSLGSGTYTVSGNILRLNGNITTADSAISLTGGSGIYLLTSATVDSNNDNTGGSGSIVMSGTISSTGGSRTLSVDSSSTDDSGGSIVMSSGASNGGGAYLTGLTITSDGTTDGSVSLAGGAYSVDGNFSATGQVSTTTATTIDTEQGNDGSAGNITFAGQSLTLSSLYAHSFNASTSAAGLNGGTVDLNTANSTTQSAQSMTIDTSAGTGGTAGNFTVPTMTTTTSSGGQSYTGGVITLLGNLTTDGGSVTLAGDTRMSASVTIDTEQGNNGSGGAVTISGTGISALAVGRTLTINTATTYDPNGTPGNGASAGNVSIIAGNGGGQYIDTLSVTTTSADGTAGTIGLGNIGTVANQTYSGGAATVSGAVTTNGGNIDLSGVTALALSGSSVTFDTDRTGGTSAAGTLNLGTLAVNGAVALTIDTTADGGGAGTDFTLQNVGNTTSVTSLSVAAKVLTVAGTTITAGTTGTGTALLSGTAGLSVADTATMTAGTVSLDAGTGTLTLGATNRLLSTGTITLTGDKMNLASTAQLGGSGAGAGTASAVILRQSTEGVALNLGSGVDTTANTLELSADEVGIARATNLRLGRGTGGAVTLSADMSPANITNFHIISGGAVTGTAGGVAATGLAVEAGGNIDITDATTEFANLALSSPGRIVTVRDANGTYTRTEVDGVSDAANPFARLTINGVLIYPLLVLSNEKAHQVARQVQQQVSFESTSQLANVTPQTAATSSTNAVNAVFATGTAVGDIFRSSGPSVQITPELRATAPGTNTLIQPLWQGSATGGIQTQDEGGRK